MRLWRWLRRPTVRIGRRLAALWTPRRILTAEQEKRLIGSVQKWARILDENTQSLSKAIPNMLEMVKKFDFSNLTPEQLREVRSGVFVFPTAAHMIAISLRQIDEHARELRRSDLWTGDVARKGSEFRRILRSEDIRDLRDVVEHGAQYLAGKGWKPHLVQDPNQDWPSSLIVGGRIVRIGVLGRAYEVREVIVAALQFAGALGQTARGSGGSTA